MSTMPVIYATEPTLGVDEFVSVLKRSDLAERRPVDDRDRLQAMLAHATLIVTARSETGELIGIARSVTDYAYCVYLSDLAVVRERQRQGIGTELIRRTHAAAGLHCRLVVLSAPNAAGYYRHIGLEHHESAWTIPPRS